MAYFSTIRCLLCRFQFRKAVAAFQLFVVILSYEHLPGAGSGFVFFSEPYAATHFRNGVRKRPESKPRGGKEKEMNNVAAVIDYRQY